MGKSREVTTFKLQSECLFGIRELKQWRQRPGRKRLVKKWIYIILHLSRCLVRLSSSELAQAKYVIPVLKSKWKYEKIADDVRILQNMQNLMISRCCFAKDGKDMWKDSKRTCRTILPIKRFVWWRPHCHSFRGLVKLRLRLWIWFICLPFRVRVANLHLPESW